jgi:hypothetical protein
MKVYIYGGGIKMTSENQLIKKAYYETYMPENETKHPIQVLGEAYLAEQLNESHDLSYIRFSQGEVYYHNKDFEAAIFKWENIENELKPWAKKNIADSYYELGLLPTAERIYTSINTECKVLPAEVTLQLYSLYIEQDKLDFAYKAIKRAVSLNPDYPNVTEIARAFFEQYGDWSSAVELAVDEAIRTESPKWFDILKTYVDKGLTETIAPDYFSRVLITLYSVNKVRFEQLVTSLWNSYKNQESFLSWIKTINDIFSNVEISQSGTWNEIPILFQETNYELINGQYLIKELSNVVPNFLTNWLKITDSYNSLFASAAVLAWSEIFPSSISSSVVNEAEDFICNSESYTGLEKSLKLFESIIKWAQDNDVEVEHRNKWIVQELADLQVNHLFIVGTAENGTSSFINSVLEENILGDTSSTLVMFKNSDDTEITEITDTDIQTVSTLSEFNNMATTNRQSDDKAYLKWNLPCQFLNETKCSFIETSGFNENINEQNEVAQYLPLADGLLFVLDANSPFTDKERDILLQMQEGEPDIPIHFLLNKMDIVDNEAEAMRIVYDTQARINEYFPNTKVFPYSSLNAISQQQSDLAEFIKSSYDFSCRSREEERTAKILFFIRNTLAELLKRRVETENGLIDSIIWDQDILVRLNGIINHLSDLEKEKMEAIAESFRTVRGEIEKELKEEIPNLLRNCSDLISEDSDFRQIHFELNEKMNERIQSYLQENLLPQFGRSIQDWITKSSEELNQSQAYLVEMSETFNDKYPEKKMKLECDFKILDDWRRDLNRMISRVQIDDENIMLRFKPVQVLLKSAGKLFGTLPKNKKLLYNTYDKYLKGKNYDDVTASITSKILHQFDLFEKSLELDITMFFGNPFTILNETVQETHAEIEKNREMLNEMKANPERYYDPLKLFELRLRYHEIMSEVPGTAKCG